MSGTAGIFADFLDLLGHGSWAEPPNHLPLRILGLSEGASREDVMKAFRDKVLTAHPDLKVAFENPNIRDLAEKGRGDLPDVQELVWARDCALKKIPAPVVTDNGPNRPFSTSTVTSPRRKYFESEPGTPRVCRLCGGSLMPPVRITKKHFNRAVLFCDSCMNDRSDFTRCRVCGVGMGRGKYCSDECEAKAQSKRRRLRREWCRGMKKCAVCGETFKPKRTDAAYCSPACKQKAYRDRAGTDGNL